MISQATVTKESINLLNGLNERKIRFAHWKSNCRLKDSLEGKTDLDILVHPDSRNAFENCMHDLGCKKLLSPAWSSYPEVEDWLAFDSETGRFLHLHTHYTLITGIKHVKHLYLPWVDIFFKHVKVDEETSWPVPIVELEAIILFIRISAKMPPRQRLKKDESVPSYIQEELIDLLKKTTAATFIELCSELGLKVPADFNLSIGKIVSEQDATEIMRISENLYKQVKPFYRKKWLSALLQSELYRTHLRIISHTMSTLGPISLKKKIVDGGKVIAFIGSDGSGKSTLTHDVIAWLSYKIDCHYFYLGKRPFVKSSGKSIKSLSDLFYNGDMRSRISRKIMGDHFFIKRIKRKIQMLRLAQKLKRKGSVVICDRFPQMKVNGMTDGMILQESGKRQSAKLEKDLFLQTIPLEPDVVFKLMVSPEASRGSHRPFCSSVPSITMS